MLYSPAIDWEQKKVKKKKQTTQSVVIIFILDYWEFH